MRVRDTEPCSPSLVVEICLSMGLAVRSGPVDGVHRQACRDGVEVSIVSWGQLTGVVSDILNSKVFFTVYLNVVWVKGVAREYEAKQRKQI